MKFSESWLREWVNHSITREQLCEKLTMAGLEIEECVPVAGTFSGVVIGQVLQVEKHPEADRLHICQVDIGSGTPLTIVCGAANVKPNMKVPTALENAILPNDLKIKLAKVRGVTSHGMLCSAKELGLAEDSEGLLVLPLDAPLGEDVRQYLHLEDYLIDVSITPNRGDCLSIKGMATEVAALTDNVVTMPVISEVAAATNDVLPVTITAKKDCPCYVGRIIRHVKADATTPIWLQERLRRSGIRRISPVVDVTNYIMLELGQPMHAFSLDKIVGGIDVRMAKTDESLMLLDGSEVNLDADTMIIADHQKPLAIAGVMGGLDSAVTLSTQDIFLESAFFQPAAIARAGRRYHLSSDSAYRFERGIDPTLQVLAIERATQLLLDIVGGEPGPVIEVREENYLPEAKTISLSRERITKILGCVIPEAIIETFLQRLGFACQKTPSGWQVTVPPRRSDITIEVDLIEEIVRLYGYDKIECHNPIATMQIHAEPENKVAMSAFKQALCHLGYHEVITYSFIDKKLQALVDPKLSPKELVNPITNDMAVMRTSLWPGLLSTLSYNQNRQQARIRLYETGLRFLLKENGELVQERMLSGLICGSVIPEQWGVPDRAADFFDLKGDIQNLLKLTHAPEEFEFKAASHSALHPGQTAAIYRNNHYVGIFGALHPSMVQTLKVEGKVFLFELVLDQIESAALPRYVGLSKFPEIRRDIAILLDQSVPAMAIQDTINEVAGDLLKKIDIFDVYQGKGIISGQKSIALALTLQDSSRTLVDEEVTNLMDRVIEALKGRFNAELRG